MVKKTATHALTAYRRVVIDDDMETRIGELAVKVGEWQRASENREAETARLIADEESAEAAVAAAYAAATNAGAEPDALERIGLKPTAAIRAVSKRAKTRPQPRPSQTSTTAAKAPLTPPSTENVDTGTVSLEVSAAPRATPQSDPPPSGSGGRSADTKPTRAAADTNTPSGTRTRS
ncbi:hypothetical protein [Nocardia camponoti]|uniref:Uncharacterized protein n=1 Tax=Nocardia camponoti TaxID=1616106 RepID=A0A917VCV5_9NOCA|nr:hypothetical protein [Nocardia camponoti]GGK63620.1 hypothetical protein GCM10011591_39790 [Nocardia camponoti]